MCVLESRFEVEAIADEPVSPDMADPNQGDEKCHSAVAEDAEAAEREWYCIRMGDIVAQATKSRASEIPNHR